MFAISLETTIDCACMPSAWAELRYAFAYAMSCLT